MSITVNILFFGATAEASGEREVEMTLDNALTARDALDRIVEKFPRLRDHKLLFARNQEYVKGDETINEGDNLAVFTAVSGG